MTWSFSTDPEYQELLDWAAEFVTTYCEPLDLVLGNPQDRTDPRVYPLIKPLQQKVRDKRLWAAHLGPELGGEGYGQLKLALLNEILGRSRWAPTIFGCQAPDSGNAEILAHYGTEQQKERYLQPLLSGEIASCYSMTEPHAGADPLLFTTSAYQDGDDWVINGEKWFSSNARYASFYIMPVVTNPDSTGHDRMSMFIVPAETPGIEIIRNTGVYGTREGDGDHAYMRYTDVRVPGDHLLGGVGQAFAIAQTRLGGGRIHHAMRTIGQVKVALEAMCERAVSRQTRSGKLSDISTTREVVADSWIEIEQFRLLVLRTAWLIDQHQDYKKVRGDIAAVKAIMPKVMTAVSQRALHLHGALGVSDEMPFARMLIEAEVMALVDGPTEVHKDTLARRILSETKPAAGVFPSGHLTTRRAEAVEFLRTLGYDATEVPHG